MRDNLLNASGWTSTKTLSQNVGVGVSGVVGRGTDLTLLS